MSKIIMIKLFVLFVLSNLYTCSNVTDCIEIKPTQETDCNKKVINEDEKYKCCYIKYKLGNKDFTACTPIISTKKELKEYEDMLKDAEELEILCSQTILKYSIGLFLLFALF